MKDRGRLLGAVLFSILLHLSLLITMELRRHLYWLRPKTKAPKTDLSSDVIRFDLVEPPLVLETPEVEKKESPARPTNILSDKNVAARDKLEKEDNINEWPYAEGKSEIKDLMEKKGFPGRDKEMVISPESALAVKEAKASLPEKAPKLPKTEELKKGEVSPQIEVVSPEEVKPKETANQGKPAEEKNAQPETREEVQKEKIVLLPSEVMKIPLYNDRLSNARGFGEVTFNASKHEVAPYIIKMKKKIEEHWAPPVIFTYYGLTSGETVIQFKIRPDGQVKDEDIKVVKEKGDESLKNASLHAIQDARPFEPIPPQVLAGEKDKYLGITFTFYYIIDKKEEENAEGEDLKN